MTVAAGAVVQSSFSLGQSRLPVTKVAVMLGGVAMPGQVQGTDLRGVAGLYFTAPTRPGTYRWSVLASTLAGCEDGGAHSLFLTVQ